MIYLADYIIITSKASVLKNQALNAVKLEIVCNSCRSTADNYKPRIYFYMKQIEVGSYYYLEAYLARTFQATTKHVNVCANLLHL